MRKVCSILSVVIIIMMFLSAYWGTPTAFYITERDTKAYLMDNGYSEADIASVSVYYDRGGDYNKRYYAEVTLNEAPQSTWIFQYDLTGTIHPVQ